LAWPREFSKAVKGAREKNFCPQTSRNVCRCFLMSLEFAPRHNQGRRAQNQVYNNDDREAVPGGVMLEKVKIMNAETTEQVRPVAEPLISREQIVMQTVLGDAVRTERPGRDDSVAGHKRTSKDTYFFTCPPSSFFHPIRNPPEGWGSLRKHKFFGCRAACIQRLIHWNCRRTLKILL